MTAPVPGHGPGPQELLATYDAQLRESAEVYPADRWDRDGPLVRAVFDEADDGGYGFVSYRSLAGFDSPGDAQRLDELIGRTLRYFAEDTSVREVEWKARGHDAPADLGARLIRHGFAPADDETVMVGEASALAVPVELPTGVTVRRVWWDNTERGKAAVRDDVSRVLAMQEEVFGAGGHLSGDTLVRRVLGDPHNLELWVAEALVDAAPVVVTAGRLELVPGTQFAGIWGGATRREWRGRGIYRALTAARARSALAKGVRYVHSDCTPDSRPILQRSGLVAITTTTPFTWAR